MGINGEKEKEQRKMKVLLTLDDLPQDRANCATCTRKGGACLREKKDKRVHNGYIYGLTGEPTGFIAGCSHYTGKYADK